MKKSDKRTAVNKVRRLNSAQLCKRGCEIYIDCQMFDYPSGRHPRSTYDQRHANILFVSTILPRGKTVLCQVKTVISGKNYISVSKLVSSPQSLNETFDQILDG
jgi:hypothetical protein